jgi:hypothetical protein
MLTPSPFPTASVYSSARARKAPIHNPFDKFTQSEFDAWISDITGALRRALGEEPTPTHTTVGRDTDAELSPDRPDRDHDLEHSAESDSDVGSEESQDVEDSFAGVRAQHAKGKARDPREGPGLGSQQHPIDIESEEEDEDEDDAEERVVEELEGDEELEEEEYEEDEQGILPSPDGTEEEEDHASEGQEYEEDVLEGEDDGEGSDIVEMTPKRTHSPHVEEVIDLVSDDEPDDEGASSGGEGPVHGPIHPPDDGHFESLFSGDEQDDHGTFTIFRVSAQ